MKHLGNITSIDPVRAGIVDCVIGGSPCQDLSIAGKRAGLGGERSGLFMEQTRICKEMREADKANGKTGVDVRPRFCVWENVPGALSSNNGEDFRIVLEEFCKIADEGASVPRPEGGWSTSGCIVGDGYSVAWRVMDARYWGVPQRRRRIALVADFGGQRAAEILFDEQGLRWDSETSRKAWESIAGHAAGSVGGSCEVKCLNPLDPQSQRLFDVEGAFQTLYAGEKGDGRNCGVCFPLETVKAFGETGHGYWQNGVQTIREGGGNRPSSPSNVICFHCQQDPVSDSINSQCLGGQAQSSSAVCYPTVTDSLCARADSSPCVELGQPFVVENCGCFMGGQGSKAGGIGYSEKESPTLKSTMSGGNTVPTTVYSILGNTASRDTSQHGNGVSENVVGTLNTQDKHCVCYDARGNGDGETVCTITGDHCNRITDYTPLVLATGQGNAEIVRSQSPCLNCNHEQPIVVAIDCINQKQIENQSGTLCAKKTGYSLNYQNPICYPAREWRKYVVRRLTPLECSRLQGLPDDWCNVPAQQEVTADDITFWRGIWDEWAKINGKKPKTDKQIEKWLKEPISESHQYQIYGNGIALPQWVYVLGRICEVLGKDRPTMASLFDGSGSFPLIWEHINGKGTAVWSSEVNPEAVRVSRYRIG